MTVRDDPNRDPGPQRDPALRSFTPDQSERRELRQEIRALMPWLPRQLVNVYVDAYIEYGDPELAKAVMRQSPIYDEYFPENRRADGSVRYEEDRYASIVEGFRDVVRSVGINPNVFAEKYPQLIAYNKSVDEFAAQVNGLYQRVVLGGDEVVQAYATTFGYPDATRESFLAALMDNDIHNALLDQQITVAEITGEAAIAGYDGADLARQLEEIDFNRAEARRFFGDAQEIIPAISVLAKRHADPDDDFDINEFASAVAFNDPEQGRRMRRLIAQEKASFQQSGQLGIRTDQAGGLAGLEAR